MNYHLLGALVNTLWSVALALFLCWVGVLLLGEPFAALLSGVLP